MLTVEFLQGQIKKLESDEANLLAHANMARGAIQMCQKILEMMNAPDALPVSELERQIGAKIEDPQPL